MGFTEKFSLGCKTFFMAGLWLAAPAVLALGLGEITLNSSLNEPLDADIVVLNSADFDEGQLLVSLASSQAFERAGISRDFFFNQMQFSIYRDSADLHVIKIITKQPVVEPYLNFLIQLQWPAGRVMREYTLLLDLPIYADAQQEVKQVVAPSTQGFDSSADKPSTTAAKAPAPRREALAGDEHRVIAGDTLWNLAERLRPRNTTIMQTMDALYLNNASAFVEGDANRIKEGSVLRLPSFDEISLETGNTVAAQIGLKNPTVASSDLEPALQQAEDFTDSDDFITQEDSQLADDGRLELASAFDGDQTGSDLISDQLAGDADGESIGQSRSALADSNRLSEELAIASDETNKVLQENIELRERMALLEAQVSTMAALVSQTENTNTNSSAEPVLGKAQAKPAAANDNLGQQLAAVPTYFWLALIAIILLLLILLVRKSSQQQESKALSEDQPLEGYAGYDEKTAPIMASSHHELNALDDLELDPDDNLFDESDTDIFDNGEEPANTEIFDMMVEAVAEADVYLSLGKTAEAIAVLEEARAEDSSDASSRLKLMEILFRENRKDELRPLFHEIEATGDDNAIEMAAIIVGPDSVAVASIVEDSVVSELEGLDFQSADLDGLGGVNLSGLELESIDLEGSGSQGSGSQGFGSQGTAAQSSDVEDFDLDNLTADDFDIEPEGGQVETASGIEDDEFDMELPGSEELEATLDELLDESPAEALYEGTAEAVNEDAAEAPNEQAAEALDNDLSKAPADDFSGFEDVDVQSSVEVKLDLAKTYIEIGDPEGAKEILEELIEDSDEEGKAKAKALLETV